MNRKLNEVYIVGGGNSLVNFDFNKLQNKDTIVINKSIFYVPNPTYFITCDYSFVMKIKKENLIGRFRDIKTTKIFVVISHLDYIQEKEGQIIDIRTNLIYNLKDFGIIIKSHESNGIGFGWNDFRDGISSGFCALQLAILLGYKRIYLLGIDLTIKNRNTHFHRGYGESIKKFQKNLDLYYKYFETGLKELKEKRSELRIYSCSQISKLNEIIPYRGNIK